ncbi:UPF0481 protein At3g47200-like [Abrus precatorius]|uniref:UPF0481 protein At3g47200-like n=1 Tax=Abrus precatorius TaxID=3816 RepID=A0A8B8MIZ8_ABRPR|nr:UPF0481 protein At3g47200-like [Abrus precatorius]
MDHSPVSILAQGNKELVSSIKEKFEAISSLKSIYSVPKKFLEANEKVYVPRTVSIGPLHHGKEILNYMEDCKWHYLFTLLSRQPNLEASLHECVNALSYLENIARNFYAEEFNLRSNKFIEMMLVDGCFIIELFLKRALKGIRRSGDPIYATPGLFNNVRCDLILLENQLPLPILQRLFKIVVTPMKCDLTLSELAIHFFRNMLLGDKEIVNEKFNQEGYHLLDLIRQCYLPTFARLQLKKHVSLDNLQCATKLRKDGIKFACSTRSLLDIKFANGVLEIPPLTIHQYTEILFSNLIAFEQQQNGPQPFTSYAFLMKDMVCNESDVKLFRRLKILIIDNFMEKDVCDIFKRLCKEMEHVEDNFYFAGQIEHIIEYKRSLSWKKILNCNCLKTRTST